MAVRRRAFRRVQLNARTHVPDRLAEIVRMCTSATHRDGKSADARRQEMTYAMTDE